MSWSLQRALSLRQPAPMSVYQHLLKLYTSTPLEKKKESLNALPESLQRKLFDSITELAGHPLESNYGQFHIFESPDQLQLAVQKIAFDIFRSLTPDLRNEIMEKVRLRGSLPNVEDLYPNNLENWGFGKEAPQNFRPERVTIAERQGTSEDENSEAKLTQPKTNFSSCLGISQLENYVADNPPLLLKTMHDSLGDLTPELQQRLTTWIDEGGPEEKRAEAGDAIVDFLRHPEKTKLDLQSLGLTSLPPIFDHYPFVVRLEELNLSHNNLSLLPEEIGELRKLRMLDLSLNHTLQKLPIRLLHLPEECAVNIENTWLSKLVCHYLEDSDNPQPILKIDALRDLFFYFLFPGDLTAELEKSLTTWVAEGSPKEQRPEAGNRIIEFLKDTEKNELILAGLDLKSLPPIFDHSPFVLRLNRLNLLNNKLTAIPEQIGHLRNLRSLELNDNQLILLPEAICQLGNLQYLSITNNRLVALPENIDKLHQLSSLHLGGNFLGVLPETMGRLQSLYSLYLNDNQLIYLPENIGGLKNLRILNLSSNLNLRQFPNGLLELSNDCEVNIENTLFSELAHHFLDETRVRLPSRLAISTLRSPRLLFLFPGDLTFEIEQALAIWEEKGDPEELRLQAKNRVIGFLKNTKENELSFSGLGLKSLPPIFNYPPFVSRLNNLILCYNSLSLLPEEIGQLQNLHYLHLHHNELVKLPEPIGLLEKLIHLSLDNNRLTELPEPIGHLQNLEHLNLDTNQLIKLPESIGRLQSLKKLLLNHNQLTILPEQIGLLKKLSFLQIDNNRLIALPDTINGLWNLEELALSGNQLLILSGEIKQLSLLKELDLSNNQLTTLPEDIEWLRDLRKLDLSSNTNLKKFSGGFLELPDDCKVNIQATWLSKYISDYLRSHPNEMAPLGPVLELDMLKSRFPLGLFRQMH